MRRLLAFAGLLVATVSLTACEDGAITGARLQHSVGATFANLWILQQTEQGHPHPPVAALHAGASCHRAEPAEPAVGAANDWACTISWLVDGPATPAAALYNLNVMTNGCYAADGDGPASLNGSASLPTATGATTINPLFEFNGCFDTS